MPIYDDNNEINKAVNLLVDSLSPEKIYLFGSHVTGQVNEDSDIDLCIVTNSDKRRIDIMHEARLALLGVVKSPIDVLVFRYDDFLERTQSKSTLEYKILSEGRVLYEH